MRTHRLTDWSMAVWLSAVLVMGMSTPAAAADPLAAAVAASHREDAAKARDQYRHPYETLKFFGIHPDMTVVEVWPGGGWYTDILAPYLKAEGRYIAAGFDSAADGYRATLSADFAQKFLSNPERYGKITVTELAPPDKLAIAPEGSADMVLTFRNLHNWMASGQAEAVLAAFYQALKPGGVLGLVEHRGDPDRPQDPKAASGYVTQAHAIALAEKAGFVLEAASEINANPRDTRDHPKGVWTLPPRLALGDVDRDKYLAVGESDRMTLRFRKPE